ncbi:Ubiquitin--protein ligase [Handroanthus impetiginosus]|uniref:RBR-type E3 ubiquitin transferase n=1 Tax=Handroanthus impetiginosus TaxID=429701 RepID=A0A2G9H947_9LAMI|nr:Ubiquitin--protein ligase [Handroanthus impetiginosus]PIN14035.1 Ubiquitin--protein ligase [Handroanthus impetiginosus]
MGNTLQTLHQNPPILPQQQQQQRRQEQDELQQEQQQRDELQQEQQQQQQSAEEENQEFTCEICIEPTLISDKKFRNTNKCSHPFCTDCMIKYIRVKLDDENVGSIKCPAYNCDHTLDPHACSSLIGPALFVRWCDVLCEEAIVGFDRCYCPYRNCNALIVNECGGNVKRSNCPNCRRLLCFECKTVWHAGFGCEESGQFRDRNDVALGRLVEQKKWKRCPRCRHFVELTEGCWIVKCR